MKAGYRSEKKRHRAIKIYGIWVLAVVLVNLAAGVIPGLGDWYIRHVFPLWVNTYGRVMDLFPFSVGEWMLALGVALVCVALALGLVLLIRGAAALAGGRPPDHSCMPHLDQALLYLFCLDAACRMYRYDAELFSAVSGQHFLGTIFF